MLNYEVSLFQVAKGFQHLWWLLLELIVFLVFSWLWSFLIPSCKSTQSNVYKTSRVGEVLSISPLLATLLWLLFIVFSFTKVVYYWNSCQTSPNILCDEAIWLSHFFFLVLLKIKNVGEILNMQKTVEQVYFFILFMEL